MVSAYASPYNHVTHQEALCQTCGVTGYEELLVYCSKCSAFPEHRYCLEKLPDRDETVNLLCEQCKNDSLKTVPFENLHLHDVRGENNVEEDNLTTKNNVEEDNKLKKRKLISANDNELECEDNILERLQIVPAKTSGCQEAEMNQLACRAAKPIIDCVWRGFLYIENEEYGPLYGHASSEACENVYNASKLLPPAICMEKLSRPDMWPNSFKAVPPTDNSIGLYFFPENARVAETVNRLLDKVMKEDLVLKFAFREVELLVFASTVLPKDHHKFLGECYLWGVYRSKKDPFLVAEANRLPEASLAERKSESDAARCSPNARNALHDSQRNKHDAASDWRKEDPCKLPREDEREEGEICDDDDDIFRWVDVVDGGGFGVVPIAS